MSKNNKLKIKLKNKFKPLRPFYIKYFRPKLHKKSKKFNKSEANIDYNKIEQKSATPDKENIDYKILNIDSSIPSQILKKTFIWFVPNWSNVWGGGHYTLFRFANHFSKHDIENIIFIYNHTDKTNIQAENELKVALKDSNLKVITKIEDLKGCDAAFATTWQSAYYVKNFPNARKKFYFMQDYESQFYAYGTQSMQANNSYTFGFIGITGGTWLKEIYESYGGKAQNYIFSSDKKIFYPSSKDGKIRNKISKLFFYGRPSTERRCYELGMLSLEAISNKYPDIEIVIAGLDLKEKPDFKATLLGNLSLAETGNLYRTCDAGIAFSATNLSYLPVELMASGCPVITNKGPQTEWYCNKNNSIIVDPVASSVLEGFDRLYNSYELRQSLVLEGLEKSKSTSWDEEMEKIYNYVVENL